MWLDRQSTATAMAVPSRSVARNTYRTLCPWEATLNPGTAMVTVVERASSIRERRLNRVGDVSEATLLANPFINVPRVLMAGINAQISMSR